MHLPKHKPPRVFGHKFCRNSNCNNELPPGFRYKYCLSCRPKLPEQLDGTLPKVTPSHAPDPSEPRACVIVSCRRPIPPLKVYRWKLCNDCRERTKLQARARKQALIDSVKGIGSGGDNATEPPPPNHKLCANNRCRKPHGRDDMLCEECRKSCASVQCTVDRVWEKSRGVNRPAMAAPPNKAKRSLKRPRPPDIYQAKPTRPSGMPRPILLPAELKLAVKTAPPPPPPSQSVAANKSNIVITTDGSSPPKPPMRSYQHIAEAMLSLQGAVRTLVRTHACEIDQTPVSLEFSGEFSVVSGQRTNEQALCLNAVCKELEKALSVKL